MKKLLVIIITILILFALWSFEAWDANPANWTSQKRGVFGIFTAGMIAIIVIAPTNIINDKTE